MQFRDWYGDYPMHCHNVVHEDHAMMIRFKIVPPTDPNAGK
jgi:FtsP/CotA-like multicopper oxidase with cupredoxin domain